jgi:hypothetical protein
LCTFQSAAPLLLPLLWVEDPLGEDHKEVDRSHAEYPAPEARHSAHDCLHIKGTVAWDGFFLLILFRKINKDFCLHGAINRTRNVRRISI